MNNTIYEVKMQEKTRKKSEHRIEMSKKIGVMVAKGFTNKEIAQKIKLSESTVNDYVRGMLDEFNCANRIQLAVMIATKK